MSSRLQGPMRDINVVVPMASPSRSRADEELPPRSPTPPSHSHSHIWHLADGTGLHAPPGDLAVEEGTGRLCCHLCGHWFRSLGSHVRIHGHTADSYRIELGLRRGQPLTYPSLSATISARQKAAYARSEAFRDRLADGQQAARSGALSRTAARARSEHPLSDRAVARQVAALDVGRETVASRREEALRRLLVESGHDDLSSFLRTRHRQGASLAQLASQTGLGRARLRTELNAAGVVTRSTGHTTAAGRRSRAVTADAEAAVRVGTDDLIKWLHTRRAEGWTLAELGRAVGHSGHWVQWRLSPDDDVTSAAMTG